MYNFEKMKTMNWSIFLGILLVLFGISLILKVIFNIDIPVVRVVIALFLIYLGIRLFIGRDFSLIPRHENENTIAFGQRTINKIEDNTEYNVVFGKGILDLRNAHPADSQEISIRLNTIFGSSDVLYNDSIPLKIRSTSAFAGTKLPNGNTEAFGTFEFNTDSSYKKPFVRIETTTVFGGTLFRKL
jgi:hypothetical protein